MQTAASQSQRSILFIQRLLSIWMLIVGINTQIAFCEFHVYHAQSGGCRGEFSDHLKVVFVLSRLGERSHVRSQGGPGELLVLKAKRAQPAA